MSWVFLPADYKSWRHCIEHDCRQPLTPAYVKERLKQLEDAKAPQNRRFVELYGQAHFDRVKQWFLEASRS